MTKDWSILNEAELNELGSLAQEYLQAKMEGRFSDSDALRASLMEWGAFPPEFGWHPVFEHPDHRSARIAKR